MSCRTALILALVAASLTVACSKDKQGPVTALINVSSQDEGSDALATATRVLVNRVEKAGGRATVETRQESTAISVRGMSLDAVKRLAERRGAFYLAELLKEQSGDVRVHQPDGSVKAVPLATVIISPDFIQVSDYQPVVVVDDAGQPQTLGGAYFESASVTADRLGRPQLDFTMTDEGGRLLEDATKRLSNIPQPVTFVLDGQPVRGANGLILAPLVQAAISKRGQISGLSQADAATLAAIIGSGEVRQSVTVSVSSPGE
jgi:preprotein translocase subunit SecD